MNLRINEKDPPPPLPDFPLKVTLGEKYDPIFEINTKEEAQRYLEKCVRHTEVHCPELSRQQAIDREKANIGYWAGYRDAGTRIRIEELFDCEHPLFGKAKNGLPTTEEAYQLGRQLVNTIKLEESLNKYIGKPNTKKTQEDIYNSVLMQLNEMNHAGIQKEIEKEYSKMFKKKYEKSQFYDKNGNTITAKEYLEQDE